MSIYTIPGILPANDTELQKGTYILILNVSKRPPHLALLIDGQVFSLTVKGPKLDMALGLQLKLIRSKSMEAIFVKLNMAIHVHNNELYKQVRSNILTFEKAGTGLATCLSPIKDFCSVVFNVDVSNVNFIFDLLPVLFKDQHVNACYHYNMGHLLVNGNYNLHKYTMNDIFESMGELV